LSAHLAVFSVEGPVEIPFQASMAVCEKLKSLFLGSCGYHFGKFNIPSHFSGHSGSNAPIREQNTHPYYLPVPDSTFNVIKQLIIFHRHDYEHNEENICDNINKLIDFEAGITWNLYLAYNGKLNDLPLNELPLLKPFLEPSTTWRSVTPFLKSRHLRIKRSEKHDREIYRHALERELSKNISFELENHGFTPASRIEFVSNHLLYPESTSNYCSDFLKEQRHHKGARMDYGHSIIIRFSSPVAGPLALGKNSHLGMGVFSTL